MEDRKVFHLNPGELTYEQAIKVIAEWWEIMRGDGINVASEVQQQRSIWRVKHKDESPGAGMADRHG